jgi:hypothetical protein
VLQLCDQPGGHAVVSNSVGQPGAGSWCRRVLSVRSKLHSQPSCSRCCASKSTGRLSTQTRKPHLMLSQLQHQHVRHPFRSEWSTTRLCSVATIPLALLPQLALPTPPPTPSRPAASTPSEASCTPRATFPQPRAAFRPDLPANCHLDPAPSPPPANHGRRCLPQRQRRGPAQRRQDFDLQGHPHRRVEVDAHRLPAIR